MPKIGNTVPSAGDVLWVDFGPPVGHEQAGRRPAVVVTDRSYNEFSSALLVCPVTRSQRSWPFKVAIPPVGAITGFVMVDQLRVVDPATRSCRFAGHVTTDALASVRERLALLFGLAL
jgi:mRNA interferase MazF